MESEVTRAPTKSKRSRFFGTVIQCSRVRKASKRVPFCRTNATRHPVAASNVSKSQSTQSATWVHVIVRPYSFTLTDNLVELCPCQQYPGLSF